MEARAMSNHRHPIARTRDGFTLIEVMIALVILAGVILAMGMSTTTASRSVRDSDFKTRAQSVAELQIGRARAWPTYSTLSELTAARFNGTADGLVTATTVSRDTLNGMNITTVTVQISAVVSSNLPTASNADRFISIAPGVTPICSVPESLRAGSPELKVAVASK
jgi:prepilin-type N-terminal cleavage/methylation domain-containing protein